MNAKEYRKVKAIANSNLPLLMDLHIGKHATPVTKKSQAFNLGNCIHDYLETGVFRPQNHNLTAIQADTATRMKYQVDGSQIIQELLKVGLPEHAIFWRINGHKCKALVDREAPGQFIDWKTTSAKSSSEFNELCKMFDYERQAAWYLMGGELRQANRTPERMLMIAIAKDSVYIKEYHREAPLVKRRIQRLKNFMHEVQPETVQKLYQFKSQFTQS